MHVVAVLPAYPPKARVGAFLATHELLTDLVRRGHRVDVLTRVRADPVFTHEGVTVGPGISKDTIDAAVAVCDVVVSHAGDDGVAAAAAARWAKPSVRMVHGYHADLSARLEGASLVVFNSHASEREAGYPGPQTVVHPPLRKIPVQQPGDRVTLVNLSFEKGGELLWRLARRLPHVQFLAVRGGWGLQLIDRRPNVEVVGPTENMEDVYARTRILLVPSERESWGMVALEAAQSGIPTIAHPTPGVYESMGEAATYADRDVEQAWIDAIERLLEPAEWETASARARAHAYRLDPQAQCDRFAEAVGGLMKGDTGGVSEADGGEGEVRAEGEGREGRGGPQRGEEGIEEEVIV